MVTHEVGQARKLMAELQSMNLMADELLPLTVLMLGVDICAMRLSIDRNTAQMKELTDAVVKLAVEP